MQLHVYGCMLTMLTDAQKYIVLRERKGLITHGMMGWSRNLNYLGEIMLYSSFAVMCQRWEVWALYCYLWGTLFVLRMTIKEWSNSKKKGWQRYKQQTWVLLPKMSHNGILSFTIYTLVMIGSVIAYQRGGIEKFFKDLLEKESADD